MYLQLHSALDPSFTASFKRLVAHKGSALDLDMTQRVDWLSRKAYFLDEPATRPPTHELVIGCQEIRDLVREGMGEREREKEKERKKRKEEAEALRAGKGRGRVGKGGKAGRGKGGRFGARGGAPNSTEAVADADSGVEFGPRSGNGTGIENGAGMRRNSDETDSSASSTYHEHERDSRFVFLEATSSTACHNYDDNEGDEEHRGLENGNGRIGEEDDEEEEEDDDIYGFNNKSYKYNYVYNTTAFPSNSPYQTQSQTRSPSTKVNPSLQQHPTYQDQDTPKKQEQEQEDQYHILHLTTPHSRPITVRDVLFHLDQFLYGEIPAEVWPEDAGVQEKVEVAHRLRVKHCTRTHGTKGYTRNRRLSALSGGSGLGAGVGLGGFGGGGGRGGGRGGGNLGGVFGYGSGFGYGVAGGPHIRSGSVSSARTTGGGGCPSTAGRGRGITGRGGLNTTTTERGGTGGGYAYTAPLCFMQVVECAGRDEMGRLVGRDRKVAARIDWMGGKFFFAGLRKPDGVYYDGSGLKGTGSAGAGGDGPGWHKEGDVRVDFVLNMEGPWARRRKSAV